MNLYSQIKPTGATYKLIQLPPDIITAIESNETLTIKQSQTSTPHLVVTSESSTWLLRQMNHSNHVMLMNKLENVNASSYGGNDVPESGLVGFADCSYEYELTPMEGFLEKSMIPVYTDGPVPKKITVSDLFDQNPVSEGEFASEWKRIGGCTLDGYAVVLSPQVVSRVIYIIITTLIVHQVDYDEAINVEELLAWLPKERPEVIRSVLEKFSIANKLDNQAVARWFGIEKLRDLSQAISTKLFLLKWKASLPEFYTIPLDVSDLRGHFYTPVSGQMCFIDRDGLSRDGKARIDQLLAINRQWDYEEFLALFEELVPPGKKPDSLIMKYARKKRVGGKFVVAPR